MVDVLVVGAGPTGLTLAGELTLHGAAVRLVERRRDRLTESRAPGVQARTLELLDSRGLAKELVSRGTPTRAATLRIAGRWTTSLPLGFAAGDTRFPYLLMVSQTETEDILEAHLESLGGRVERDTTLVGFDQDNGGVTARLRRPDGSEESVRTSYLVGADGVHSTVRELLDIPFAGETYPRSFVLGDVHVDGVEGRSVHAFVGRDGLALLIPLSTPAPWRIITLERRGSPSDAEASLADLQRRTDDLSRRRLALRDPVWISRFGVHCRMADRFRHNRVFLAGDAAHVHSPAGAQGMNTGMQDAWNLGWKLALVATGRAYTDLLDSYEPERMPVARFVLRFTDRLFSVMASPNPVVGSVRTLMLGPAAMILTKFRWLRRRAFRTISQLAIEYPHSPAIQAGAGQRVPDVALPDGGRLHERLGPGHHLLVCGPHQLPDVDQPYGPLLTVHHLPAGVLESDVYLVRPDGYIAHRGVDGLDAFLARWLIPNRAASRFGGDPEAPDKGPTPSE